MPDKIENRILGCCPNIGDPVLRDAVGKKLVIGASGKEQWQFGPNRNRRGFGRLLNPYLLNALANLDDLSSACLWMRFYPPPLRPIISGIMMIDVADKKTFFGFVNNQPYIAADTHRPEILVLGVIDAVELKPGLGRVHLKVEDSGFHCLLLLGRKSRQRFRKGISDTKLHDRPYTAKTFMTSSPK
ncbi:MAG: hypothetical protein ACREDT_01505 [Methylocella sp.]